MDLLQIQRRGDAAVSLRGAALPWDRERAGGRRRGARTAVPLPEALAPRRKAFSGCSAAYRL